MKTEIRRINPDHPEEEIIRRAGDIVKAGGLVAFPTETVYGLGGDALQADASAKIYAAKGRPSDNPLIVHIADLTALDPIAREVPEQAYALSAAFWPGPLTMIFKKTDLVPDATSGGLPTVAVRMPSHPVAAALIRASGGYIAAPSANLSGRPSPTTASHVIEDLSGRCEMILDGGAVSIGLESTIVDMTEDIPTILRPGYINEDMLKRVLGEVRMDPGIVSGASEHVRPKAPGMRYRHYAPRAPLIVVEGEPEAVAAYINERVEEARAVGQKAGVLASDELRRRYEGGIVRCAGDRAHDVTIAQHLFEILRAFDADGVDVIYSEAFETPRMGEAIMNRLLKAAGHTVVRV